MVPNLSVFIAIEGLIGMIIMMKVGDLASIVYAPLNKDPMMMPDGMLVTAAGLGMIESHLVVECHAVVPPRGTETVGLSLRSPSPLPVVMVITRSPIFFLLVAIPPRPT